MQTYHKIQTVFKRDMTQRNAPIQIGEFSMPEFEYLKDNIWEFEEKIDGTNIRVMWDGKSVVFGGKTDEAQMPVFLMYKLQELFDTTPQRGKFAELFAPKEETEIVQVCLYGEGYGAKIQKGGGNYIKDGVDFVLFDVKVGDLYLRREDVREIAEKLGIKSAPVVGEGTLSDLVDKVKAGFNSAWGEFPAEGIVARPKTELKTRRGERIITKLKFRDFQV